MNGQKQGRTVRQRVLTNENDENSGRTRVTRAKTAALSGTGNGHAEVTKKSVQAKKSVSSVSAANVAQPRKRAALGDVSNVVKSEYEETRETKKSVHNKAGLVSKAAQPSRVQKTSRTNSSRSILGAKDKNASSELKRPSSGSGAGNHAVKKRNTHTSVKESTEDTEPENVQPSKTKSVVSVEIESSIKISKTEQTIEEASVTKSEEKATAPSSADIAHVQSVIRELETGDYEDPRMVAEYANEIFSYLNELEFATMANPDYMTDQSELDWKMRGILVDWLLEVHTRFRLLPETLFLAVNIIDRFLSCKVVQLDRLQLVGVTAMFIASKYEEVLSPHVQNFRNVADDGFTENEILSAERFILAALDYDLSYPNPMNFLRRISKADNYDIETRTLGKYLLEISCLDHRFINHQPSQIAAAAMYLARVALGKGKWVSNESGRIRL